MTQIGTAARARPAAEVHAETSRSIPSLFLGMVMRPRDTLTYLRDHGGHTWIWPALAAMALLILSQLVTASIRNNQGDSTAQISLAAYGVPLAALALGWALRAGLLIGLSSALGGKGRLGAMARMSMWTTLPDTARTLVVASASAATGQVASSGLGFLQQFISAGTAAAGGGQPSISFTQLLVSQFLSSLDIYTVWELILIGIGVAVTANLSRVKSAVVVAGFWALTLVVAALPSLLGSSLGQFLGNGAGITGGGVPGGAGGGAPPTGGGAMPGGGGGPPGGAP